MKEASKPGPARFADNRFPGLVRRVGHGFDAGGIILGFLHHVAMARLEDGADVKAELLYMDLVRQIEKIGDRCFNIAEQLALTK